MVSSLFQIFIGFSGLMGFLLRFIGPLTVAPTISLVGLSLYGASSDFAGKLSWKREYCQMVLQNCFSACVQKCILLISTDTIVRIVRHNL